MANSTHYTRCARAVRKNAILAYIKDYSEQNKVMPTIIEIARALQYSRTDVWRLQQEMFAEGMLLQTPDQINKHRAYTIPVQAEQHT